MPLAWRRAGTYLAIVVLLAFLPITSCREGPNVLPPVSIDSAEFAPALGVDLAASRTTSSGLRIRDLRIGDGAEVRAGQRVSVHYRGSLADGTQFDANQPGKSPFSFRLGEGSVIRGWDEGVAGMRVGGERQLIIPPELGYGARGIGPIPGNAILVFTVSVVGAD